MAAVDNPSSANAPPETFTFRGHPQPPPDERLQECKNFLADEDVNQNLGFADKLTQIEEYIKDLEEKNIQCSKRLLKDVKIMATVHREWMDQYMDKSSSDLDVLTPAPAPLTSNRLISQAVAKELREQRKANGLQNQIRDSHAPFTTGREDHYEFLKKLKDDEQAHPDEFDEGTNLAAVEGRAYQRALKEPSMIPVWLHPRLGLPSKGIKVTDENPWYRAAGVLRGKQVGKSWRPAPQTLPPHLQHAQDTINVLLKSFVNGSLTHDGLQYLEKLLSPHELISIRNLRAELDDLLMHHPEQNKSRVVKEKIEKHRIEIAAARRSWLSSFAKDGVQLMVGDGPVIKILQPGVFYIPYGEPSADELSRLERVKARTNALLRMTPEDLNESERDREELAAYFQSRWTPELRQMFNLLSEVPTPRTSTAEAKRLTRGLAERFIQAQIAFLEPFLNTTIQLRYQRPGEIEELASDVVYIPWSPDKQLAEPPTTHLGLGEDLEQLENDVNGVLQRLDTYPGKMSRKEQKSLEKQLEKVIYPDLRKLRDKYLELKAPAARKTPDFRDAEFFYHRSCYRWINSLLDSGVRIQPTPSTPEVYRFGDPGDLYFRHSWPEKKLFEFREKGIPRSLLDDPGLRSNPEDSPIYPLLVLLQYPRLKRLDQAWRGMASHPDRTPAEIEEEQDAKNVWRKAFTSWVVAMDGRSLEIHSTTEEVDDSLGDPSTVYYRGPLERLDPDSPESPSDRQDPELTRRIVDYAFLLLNSYSNLACDKIELANRLQAMSALPPSLTRKLRQYYSLLANSSPNAFEVKRSFRAAFTAWEERIRSLARPVPTSALDRPLPPAIQETENEINRLLENPLLHSVEDVQRLNQLIEPFLEPFLDGLRKKRIERLRDQGSSKERIDAEDLSINAFRMDVEYFKASARARGFRLRESAPGTFVAVDPDWSNTWKLGRSEREDLLLNTQWSKQRSGLNYDTGNVNRSRDDLSRTEEEVISLLRYHHRPAHEVKADQWLEEYSRARTKEEDRRLIYILRPFFPSRIRQAYTQLECIDELPAKVSREEKASLVKTFLDIYEPWIRRLELLGPVLHITFGNTENVGDAGHEFLFYPRKRVPLIGKRWSEVEVDDQPTKPLPKGFQKIEDELSTLLVARGDPPTHLSLVKEERLRYLLRAIMPASIKREDDSIRKAGVKVRQTKMESVAEVALYLNRVERWRNDYYGWVDELSGTPVRLAVRGAGDRDPPRNSNIMFITVKSIGMMGKPPPPNTSLPVFLELQQGLLNRYLLGSGGFIGTEEEECHHFLYLVWKEYGDRHVRQAWYHQLQTTYGIKGSLGESSRVEAVVNALARSSFAAFKKEIIEGDLKFVAEFVETQPENFSVVLRPSHPDPASLLGVESVVSKTLTLRPVLEPSLEGHLTLETIRNFKIPDVLDKAFKEFIALAQILRDAKDSASNPSVTVEERKQAQDYLQPLSKDAINTLETDLGQLCREFWSDGIKEPGMLDRLKELTLRQVWYFWGAANPDIRSFLLDPVVYSDPIGRLLEPMIAGEEPRRYPALDPPTADEVLELEVKIENLLYEFRGKKLDAQGTRQLQWLTEPLLPPVLNRYFKNLRDLRWKAVSREGLSVNENVMLYALEICIPDLFTTWASQLQSLDHLLNESHFNSQVMLKFYARYKLWKKAIKEAETNASIDVEPTLEPLLEVPDTPKQIIDGKLVIKDEKLRNQHDNHELLKLFTENFDGNYRDKLLLEHMDPPLRDLFDEIQSLRDSASVRPLDFDESLRLRTVTEDFVKDHMNWFSSLTPKQIQLFREDSIDFSAKAERRGVRRAAVELGLNLLATNQEQHRVYDRFRRVQLPPPYRPPPAEVPLWKPLEAWKRPLELDPFKYTKLMHKFRRWKEHDYEKARARVMEGECAPIEPPANYNGPFVQTSLLDFQKMVSSRHRRLVEIVSQLLQANRTAPRPLLERICILISEATAQSSRSDHPLRDDIVLTGADAEVLLALTHPSWSEESQPWRGINYFRGFPEAEPEFSRELARLEEFEREIKDLPAHPVDIPFWKPRAPLQSKADSSSSLAQPQYLSHLSSTEGISTENLHYLLQTARVRRTGSPGSVEVSDTKRYLQAMHDHGRIHYDADTNMVSRIPLSGHPENKYVESAEVAGNTHYITFDDTTKKYMVRIDEQGNRATPIFQPNKYEHYQRLAFRLGRDIRLLAEAIAERNDEQTLLSKQYEALRNTLGQMLEINSAHAEGAIDPVSGKELSLRRIARDILELAPELRVNAGLDPNGDIDDITTKEAALVIQLQLIEESNNNWESRFPEDEHVWDWVDDPLVTDPLSASQQVGDTSTDVVPRGKSSASQSQYFSLRRWPLECQSAAAQAVIKSSGPIPLVATGTEPELEEPSENLSRRQIAEGRRNAVGPFPKERYTGVGGAPYFPFGETPYQKAWQSFRMEQDLADVEEFQRPPTPTGIINRLKRKLAPPEIPYGERLNLPAIPADWNPTSVSRDVKLHDIIQKAKQTEGLPDTDEAYYTPAEVAQIAQNKVLIAEENERRRARAEIEAQSGKSYSQLTRAELRDWQDKLDIDPFKETFRDQPSATESPRNPRATHVSEDAEMSGGLSDGDSVALFLSGRRVKESRAPKRNASMPPAGGSPPRRSRLV